MNLSAVMLPRSRLERCMTYDGEGVKDDEKRLAAAVKSPSHVSVNHALLICKTNITVTTTSDLRFVYTPKRPVIHSRNHRALYIRKQT